MLSVQHELPDGQTEPVMVSPQTRGGLTTYDIRDTPQKTGVHSMHVNLYAKPIKGSPVQYTVHPDYHECANSLLFAPEPPEESDHLYTEEEYIVKLTLRDRFCNQCERGGATVAAKLTYIKQGVHDSTALTPANHTVAVEARTFVHCELRRVAHAHGLGAG